MGGPFGRDQPPARRKLIQQGLRNGQARRSHNNSIERRHAGHAQHAVAMDQAHPGGQAQRPQMAARQLVQAADTLDGMHLAHDLGQYRRLVAAAGANLEHPRRSTVLADSGDHAGHHPRLRNGLRVPDGQRRVFVGTAGQRFVDEQMARHRRHGVEHPFVGDALRAQPLHHRLAQPVGVQAQVAAGQRRGLRRRARQGARRNAGVAVGRRDAGREAAAGRRVYAFTHSGSAQLRTSSSWLCWVRSRRSGVTETCPCAVAWKSVPGVASAARPTGPTQYTVSP